MSDTTETGLPRAVAIAWGMQAVPQRGPNRGLSHERIVAAAIEIADSDGLAAVTMQAVAKSLGFTTMSLYRYVSSKDELLALMQDAALEVPEIELDDDWRVALKQWASLVREAYRSRPWVLSIPRGPVSVLMPCSVRAADLGLRAVSGLALTESERVGLLLVISVYASSMVEMEQSLAEQGELTVGSEGLDLLGEAITPARFPYLAPLLMSGGYVVHDPVDADDPQGIDDDYELGLDLIIAGLDALEHRRRVVNADDG